MLAAGRVITMTGGHGYFIGREADGADAVRAATRAEIKEGAHFIKAMATGGVLTPGVTPTQTALQPDELEAVAREAHNSGRRAACHAIGNAGIKNAVRAGIDSIEHAYYLDDEALELMIDHSTYVVPTLLAGHQIVSNGQAGRVPSWITEKSLASAEHHRESFAAAVKSGLKIAAGTDAGTPFNPHGDLAAELKLMVDYGLSPAAAIVAATRNAAENLGLLGDTGTVEVGKRADLILVDGDPTADISCLSRVSHVISNGMTIGRLGLVRDYRRISRRSRPDLLGWCGHPRAWGPGLVCRPGQPANDGRARPRLRADIQCPAVCGQPVRHALQAGAVPHPGGSFPAARCCPASQASSTWVRRVWSSMASKRLSCPISSGVC